MNSGGQNIPLLTNVGSGFYKKYFLKINTTQLCANPIPGIARQSHGRRPGKAKK